jgi:hypothetical protein
MKSDQSVPLSEALERFSDPRDWQEFNSLGYSEYRIFIVGAPETESDRRQRRAGELKARLEVEILAKLTAGSLQATGYECPVGLDDERRLIRAEWWDKLKPDFAASEANGAGGLHVVDIRVQESPARSPSGSAEEYVSGGHGSLAKLRADVRRWLQREARVRGTSWQKKHYRSAARTRFGDRVTDNLFNEVWRSADLPEALRRPGLRKANRYSTGSSPPV